MNKKQNRNKYGEYRPNDWVADYALIIVVMLVGSFGAVNTIVNRVSALEATYKVEHGLNDQLEANPCDLEAVQCEGEPVPVAKEEPKKPIVEKPVVKIVNQPLETVVKQTCAKKGLGDYCVQDLMAMAWVESSHDCKVNGDSGKSFGCWQIHRGWHPEVSVAQAQDPTFGSTWTINRMVHFGYPKMRSYAIMKHNGTPNTPKTLEYLAKVNSYAGN